jgi:hypothetical protein
MVDSYYSSITIDNTVLAVDGELNNLLTMRVLSSEENIPVREHEDPHNSHLGSTFVPLTTTGATERDAI